MVDQWDVLWRLLLALVLASSIGLERQMRQKSAGLRTYTLVGVGSALFMLVSQYGFSSALGHSHVILDPSRVAAQVVSGIGFIGVTADDTYPIGAVRGEIQTLTSPGDPTVR